MDRWRRRSRGVSQTAVAEAREAPAEADLVFDRLYRTSRDDVYAYVAGLLHDGPAAEGVTASAPSGDSPCAPPSRASSRVSAS